MKMQNSTLKTFLVLVAVVLVAPASYANCFASTKGVSQEHCSDMLDGTVIGFSFGSMMSSGSAQQAVNQGAEREEAIRQKNARQEGAGKGKAAQGAAARREPATGNTGESGRGHTDSGAEERSSTPPPAANNW